MGYSKFIGKDDSGSQLKSDLVYVMEELIVESNGIRAEIGHYEQNGVQNGGQKIYIKKKGNRDKETIIAKLDLKDGKAYKEIISGIDNWFNS